MKVSKNSFRPPPKVDSSVVRLEPRNPAPQVNFIEWDGLVRLCFNRKNRTLSAIFHTKSVLKLLAENLKTQRALAGGTVADGMPLLPPPVAAASATDARPSPFASALAPPLTGASSMDVELDEEDEDDGVGGLKAELLPVRALVDEVLAATGFAEQRASKMDLDDFMALLARFNAAGIHFYGTGIESGD